jgi:hypothetical protein
MASVIVLGSLRDGLVFVATGDMCVGIGLCLLIGPLVTNLPG